MSIKTYEIRVATAQDAKRIAFVHIESWRSTYRGILPGKELEVNIARRDSNWWQNAIQRGLRVLVMEFSGKIVGYATMGASRMKWSEPAGEIFELYLLPTYQGIGLGRKLLKAASERLSQLGFKALLVWSLENNHTACAFYEHVKGTAVARAHEKFEGKPVLKVGYAWRL